VAVLSGALPVDDWLTEVEAAGAGEGALWVICFTATVDEVVGAGAVVGGLSEAMTAMLGLEPPPPLTGPVAAAGWAVVLVAAAGADGAGAGTGVAGAALLPLTGTAVVTVAPDVPWEPVEAPGAVSAEAGRAPRSRKRPARSAKDAAHLRGLTASLLGLVLIWLDRPPCLNCVREGRKTSAGTREV